MTIERRDQPLLDPQVLRELERLGADLGEDVLGEVIAAFEGSAPAPCGAASQGDGCDEQEAPSRRRGAKATRERHPNLQSQARAARSAARANTLVSRVYGAFGKSAAILDV